MVTLTHVNVDGQDGIEACGIPVEQWDVASFDVQVEVGAVNAEFGRIGWPILVLRPGRGSVVSACPRRSCSANRMVAVRAGSLQQMF